VVSVALTGSVVGRTLRWKAALDVRGWPVRVQPSPTYRRGSPTRVLFFASFVTKARCMSTVGKIDIKSETLGHALLDNTLTVPINQRSYAWEKKHVLELFQDLANAIAQHEPEYFLGSIVVTKKESGRPEVVDGQQRLATTAILLAAMRDFFHKNSEGNRASDLQRDYLIRRDLVTQEPLPRLILNEIDRDYFTKHVLSEPGTPERQIAATKESHHRINAASDLASDYVKTIVKGYSVQDQSERLLEWIKFITDGARVIWVNVPDDANAYVMFETLNDRGLELSKADLLKNYLFGRSQDRLQETQQRWFLMLGALETVGGEELTVTYIRHLWSSMHGPTRERELFSEIKGTIKSKQAAIGLANDLGENANLYAAILNPSHSFWNDFAPSTRKHIATLQQLQMQQVRPLLLAVATLPKVEVARALRLLVNYSVRFLIVGGLGGGALEDQYARLAIKIRSNKITTAKALAQELGKVVPLDVAFRSSFEL
jgi:uncharacterized protein DUF262